MKAQLGFLAISFKSAPQLPILSGWRRVLARVSRWRELARQRRALAGLSDAALKDIGLSRADIYEEVEKPFWVDHLRR
ncbi:DUF1127 domain-containing protein [Pseudomonas panipatensis]